MEAKHAPTPWVNIGGYITEPVDGETIGEVIYWSGRENEQKANADFIVRVCNAHYQLVAALDQALGVMEDNCRGTGGNDYSDGAIEAARTAIAAAGAA